MGFSYGSESGINLLNGVPSDEQRTCRQVYRVLEVPWPCKWAETGDGAREDGCPVFTTSAVPGARNDNDGLGADAVTERKVSGVERLLMVASITCCHILLRSPFMHAGRISVLCLIISLDSRSNHQSVQSPFLALLSFFFFRTAFR